MLWLRAMPSNIEIKARLVNASHAHALAKKLSGAEPEIIWQTDTFFQVQEGRLKLREFDAKRGQLIFYRRADVAGCKQSDYRIVETAEPGALRETLAMALGALQMVKKRRALFLVGQTRIHVDAVVGLGDFLELEVVMRDGQSAEEAQVVAQGIMAALGITPEQWVEGSYADLQALRDVG